MKTKQMTSIIGVFSLYFSMLFCGACSNDDSAEPAPPPPKVEDTSHISVTVTNKSQSFLFSEISNSVSVGSNASNTTLSISTSEVYQEMDGFGYTLTGGSAYHLYNMGSSKRAELLKELFSTEGTGIGVSYLRISIGASDLDAEPFSYNELPDGEEDLNMEKFSIAEDKKYLIPVLKEILAINPAIKILGSPWSPPTWMKTNKSFKGGELKTSHYNAYGLYFVKYIQAMKAEGITIDAVTIQNEPLHPGNNPSLLMEADAQANFIASSLGPKFQEYGISTKIICYDHNADRPDYPIEVFNNTNANPYVDGSAFHLYGGSIDDLSQVHTAFPDKNIYFTEQWVGAGSDFGDNLMWHVKNLIIGAPRNWSKNVLEWNLAANSALEPHTDGGCDQCLGALTIDGNILKRNVAYYIIAHASKYVRPGSVRVKSNSPSDLPNVAYKAPDESIVVVVMNESDQEKKFNLRIEETNEEYIITLPANSVGTIVNKQKDN
ncbi:glycoside hydrolase family 30 beta sandwich domain-containing protein [Flammeovirgaceae bacterium SG7u.111]|nr:glycoside hydrolase family 30 beta sandwich domain-containing protein [Flammeovirgaceae bacterium SG7u.132]WPO37778.1 glycoside hydrolase family 30 beta sandwich domain-containing protein [Flammeovirgaceae bacterium SG7u.111]